MDQENKVSNLKIFFFHPWVKLERVDFDLNTLFDLAHHIVKKRLYELTNHDAHSNSEI